MIKAVIFDVDGTLIESNDLHAQAWADAFGEFGKDIGLQMVRPQIGKGGDQLLPVFLSPDEIESFGDKLEKRRGEILQERYLRKIKPFAGVRALFQRLHDDGITLALASSAKRDELMFYKKIADIGDLVDVETSSDDAGRSKPEPDIFAAALGRLKQVDPAEVLVVGDTPYDAEAAAKAGLACVGVLCGGFPAAALEQAGCRAIYRDPDDLLANYPACFS